MVSITASASHCFHNVECRVQEFLAEHFELDSLITSHHSQPQAPPEVIMNRLTPIPLLIAVALCATQASAESVVPLKGQTSQQTQIDINDCHSIASTSTTSTPQAGGRLKGAAVGAAAGAAGAQVRGRQHDELYERVDDDRKQDYRQNRAKETAAAGAVIGGSRQRQERRAQGKTEAAASSSAYAGCLQGRGYQITP